MSGAHGARRAVAYLRLSEDVESHVRPAAEASGQRLAIEAWAERECVEIRSWQLDIVPGDTPIARRPGLLAAYAAIREHRAGMLVAANADRFGHDELVCWLIERAALTQGATLHTADGSRSRARTKIEAPEENVAYSRGAIDLARAHNRLVLRSRVRAALAEKTAPAKRLGTIPYGHRVAADGVHVEIDKAEQASVSRVRRLSGDSL